MVATTNRLTPPQSAPEVKMTGLKTLIDGLEELANQFIEKAILGAIQEVNPKCMPTPADKKHISQLIRTKEPLSPSTHTPSQPMLKAAEDLICILKTEGSTPAEDKHSQRPIIAINLTAASLAVKTLLPGYYAESTRSIVDHHIRLYRYLRSHIKTLRTFDVAIGRESLLAADQEYTSLRTKFAEFGEFGESYQVKAFEDLNQDLRVALFSYKNTKNPTEKAQIAAKLETIITDKYSELTINLQKKLTEQYTVDALDALLISLNDKEMCFLTDIQKELKIHLPADIILQKDISSLFDTANTIRRENVRLIQWESPEKIKEFFDRIREKLPKEKEKQERTARLFDLIICVRKIEEARFALIQHKHTHITAPSMPSISHYTPKDFLTVIKNWAQQTLNILAPRKKNIDDEKNQSLQKEVTSPAAAHSAPITLPATPLPIAQPTSTLSSSAPQPVRTPHNLNSKTALSSSAPTQERITSPSNKTAAKPSALKSRPPRKKGRRIRGIADPITDSLSNSSESIPNTNGFIESPTSITPTSSLASYVATNNVSILTTMMSPSAKDEGIIDATSSTTPIVSSEDLTKASETTHPQLTCSTITTPSSAALIEGSHVASPQSAVIPTTETQSLDATSPHASHLSTTTSIITSSLNQASVAPDSQATNAAIDTLSSSSIPTRRIKLRQAPPSSTSNNSLRTPFPSRLTISTEYSNESHTRGRSRHCLIPPKEKEPTPSNAPLKKEIVILSPGEKAKRILEAKLTSIEKTPWSVGFGGEPLVTRARISEGKILPAKIIYVPRTVKLQWLVIQAAYKASETSKEDSIWTNALLECEALRLNAIAKPSFWRKKTTTAIYKKECFSLEEKSQSNTKDEPVTIEQHAARKGRRPSS
jgi:hypothetical protein